MADRDHITLSLKLTSLRGPENRRKVEDFIYIYFRDKLGLPKTPLLDEKLFVLNWFISESMANAIKAQQIHMIAREKSLDINDLKQREQVYSLFSKYKGEKEKLEKINRQISANEDEPLLAFHLDIPQNKLSFAVYNWTSLPSLDEERFITRIQMALEKMAVRDEETGEEKQIYKHTPDSIVPDTLGGGANFGVYSVAQSLHEHFGIGPSQFKLTQGQKDDQLDIHGEYVVASLVLPYDRFLEIVTGKA